MNSRHVGLVVLFVIVIGLLWASRTKWHASSNAVPESSERDMASHVPAGGRAELPDGTTTAPDATQAGAATLHTQTSPFPDPDKARRMRESRVQSLENKMVSQPVSPQWAARNEKAIMQYVASGMAQDFPGGISNADAECRTDICRIKLVVANDVDVALALHGLFSHVNDALPSSELYEFPRPDGTVDVVVYAAAGSNTSASQFTGNR